MQTIWQALIDILADSALFLLAGFGLAGLLHAVLERKGRLLDPLTGPGRRPVILATLVGLPLPLCSCSVLPTGMALLKRGASKGATSSFLVTVPETDIVSILLTYGLMGPVMAVFRPLASLVTGIATGLTVNYAERRRRPDRRPPAAAPESRDPGRSPDFGSEPGQGGDDSLTSAAGRDRRGGPAGWLKDAVKFGFGEFFDDLAGRLLIGIVLGALITALVPALNLDLVTSQPVVTYLLMIVIGVPMYVCATSSTPIAAGLMVSGVSPGAALVFLLVGPATNTASILVLSKQFGRFAFTIYLTAIVVVSLLMGLLLDAIATAVPVGASASLPAAGRTIGPVAIGSMVLFLSLCGLSFRRTGALSRTGAWLSRRTGLAVSRRTLGLTLAAAVAVLYLLSGFFVVQPGERAAVKSFGRVIAHDLGPGLHYCWPQPFAGADVAEVARIRRVELGFAGQPAESPAAPQPAAGGGIAESWMLTGDENIIDIQCVVHYRIADTPQALMDYLYGVVDGEQLVRAASEWAVRKAVCRRGIDSLLTVDRAVVEHSVQHEYLQPALDACRCGMRVLSVALNSVHAPPPVHPAFRDVASAAEDAVQAVNKGKEYSERVVREARGASFMNVALAHGRACDRIAAAKGESVAFALLSEVYLQRPPLVRSRLYLEKLDAVLPPLNKYVDLTPAGGPGPDIWLRSGESFDAVPFLAPPPSPAEEDR